MQNILILYSTTDGHTLKICQRIQSVLENAGSTVTLLPLASAGATDLEAPDIIVIGASIRYGKHKQEVRQFVSDHRDILENKISAFFSVNVVARKPGKNTPENNPYLKKFLSTVAWKPDLPAVFAGKIDYQKYGFVDRMMIRLIMWITKGPTDPQGVFEFTDWDKVDGFAALLGEMPGQGDA